MSKAGGSTELYHTGNAKKLETTTTGITVTGNLVSTGAAINGDIDGVESGSSQAGTTYTTTSSYSSY